MPSEKSTLYGNTQTKSSGKLILSDGRSMPRGGHRISREGDPAWNRTIQQFPIALPWPR